jgi:CelD/BcsL family acetyltransferase involved in cellulose biosynthesis
MNYVKLLLLPKIHRKKTMQIDVLRNKAEIDAISSEWNRLLERSASHVPFLRHEYLTSWWNTLGGGEWESGELCVLTARDKKNDLIGIAPLFSTTNLDGKPALMFLGSIEISDYLDFIVKPGILPEFTDAMLEYLTGSEVDDWEVLDLYNFTDDSPSLPALKESALKHGLTFKQENLQPAPVVQLAATWDEYLAGIAKKQRHEIRRKIRRAEGNLVPVNWYIVKDEDSLDTEIEDFLKLMAYDHHKEEFLTEVMRSQMRASVHAAFRAGWLQLSFLTVGDEKAAAYLNFDYANQIWVYNSGINFNYSNLSPGWVLLGYLIQWAIENGRETFDFMRGDETYKYRFGGEDKFVIRAQVER